MGQTVVAARIRVYLIYSYSLHGTVRDRLLLNVFRVFRSSARLRRLPRWILGSYTMVER
jgi:hypothetical protein